MSDQIQSNPDDQPFKGYHEGQQTTIPPFILGPDFFSSGQSKVLNDRNFFRIRIYLDLLQYSSEEQK